MATNLAAKPTDRWRSPVSWGSRSGTEEAQAVTAAPGRKTPALSQSARRAVLTAHIIVSVGLLGDSAGFLAVAARGAGTDDGQLARASWELLNMFSLVFGIPLSLAALVTGLTLGLGTKWGVLRYQWTTIKLTLIVSVMVVGGVVIGPTMNGLRAGGVHGETTLILAAAYDVLALALAVGLSVYKPGRGWRRRAKETAA